MIDAATRAALASRPATLTALYFDALDRFGRRPVALRAKRNGRWVDLSYPDVAERVEALSHGLLDLGVGPGDRVAVLSENRPEWAITDFACLAARAIDVPIYPTLPAKQIAFILRDAGAVAVCVSSAEQLAKIEAIRRELPDLRHVIAFDAGVGSAPAVLPLESVYARGRATRSRRPGWRADALGATPNDAATIIYTSGTTGDPKGVVLTHGNIASNVAGGLTSLPLRDDDECLSFLPLSHIFERMAGHYCMFTSGAIINYATSPDTVAVEMTEVRPTVVCSVPRLYEKIYGRVLDNAESGSAVKRKIFAWARRTGERWSDYALARRPAPRALAAQRALADRLVFSKLRARTGGRMRFFVSGGAPLSAEIARFFFAAGLPILEGYGLTETSPVIAVNSFDHLKIGTVGRILPNVEARIAPDGEILTRGPHVMQGYYRKPEATAEVIDPDGWLHTGDVGLLDAEGFLKITDRKKDLIVTAGGKNIAPQPIENLVKSSKYVANVVMLGDRRKFPIVLVVPNPDPLRAWATEQGLPIDDMAALIARPETAAMIEREVMRPLAELARFEQPKRVVLVAQDFTIESGELTPTLKVKRRVVERNYRDRIEAIYAAAEHDHTPTGLVL